MDPSPLRVISLCSLILGSFFLAKSISIKTPKYVLHELLAFKVNKSRFFRKYLRQKLDSIIGFIFLFVGFGLQIYLEFEQDRSNWAWAILITVAAIFAIAFLLSRITRFFSGKAFVEHVRFMVEAHDYPLENDEGLVLELGNVMKIPRDDMDTVESYCEKVRTKMKLGAPGKRPERRPPYR